MTDEGASLNTASNETPQGASSSSGSANVNQYYGRPVTLYHYTNEEGANGIRRDSRLIQGYCVSRRQYNVHGQGVYFTRYDPGTPRRKLIRNLFVNSGKRLRKATVFYDRIQYVVRIEFNANDRIEEIIDGCRDLFVHRGDIDLKNYKRKFRIYPNPNAP